jgi:hypothetical protein
MNCRWLLIFASVLLLSGCGGSQPSAYAPSTQAEAQAAYSRTRWYFARQLAFSKLVPEPGTPARHDSDTQAVFQLASGDCLIYTEYLPSTGIKTFHGQGRLEPIPELVSSIYRLKGPPYTEVHPDVIIVVGFCGDRMFQVQAQGTNQQTVMREVVSLATNALASLRSQALNR